MMTSIIDEEDLWERDLDSGDDFGIEDYFSLGLSKDPDDECVQFLFLMQNESYNFCIQNVVVLSVSPCCDALLASRGIQRRRECRIQAR